MAVRKQSQELSDRVLTKEEALGRLKKMLSEPEVKRIARRDTIVSGETARKIGDLLIYANDHKEYLADRMDKYVRAKLFILTEVFERYMERRRN